MNSIQLNSCDTFILRSNFNFSDDEKKLKEEARERLIQEIGKQIHSRDVSFFIIFLKYFFLHKSKLYRLRL